MNTIRLTLQRYRRFHARSVFCLQPGLTVISGENGAGKSTLGQAILHALFAAGPKPDPRSDGADEPYHLELTLRDHQTNLDVTAHSGKYQVQIDGQPQIGGVTGTQRAAQAVLVEYLGLINQRSFEKVYFALQNDTAAFVGMKPKDRRELIDEVLQLRTVKVAVEEQTKHVRAQRDVVLNRLSAAAESAATLCPLDRFQTPIKTFSQATSANSRRGALATFRTELALAVAAQQQVVAGCRQTLDELEAALRGRTETTQTKQAGVTAAEQVCEAFSAAQTEKQRASRALASADAEVTTLQQMVDALHAKVAAARAAEPEAREFEVETGRRQQLQRQLDEHLQHKPLAAAWASAQARRVGLEEQLKRYASLPEEARTHLDQLGDWQREAEAYASDPFVTPLAEAKATLTQLGKDEMALKQQQAHLRQEHTLLACPTCGAPMTAAQRRQREREVNAQLTLIASSIGTCRDQLAGLEQEQRDWAARHAEIEDALEAARHRCGQDAQHQSARTLLEGQLGDACQEEAAALRECHSRGVSMPLNPGMEQRLRRELKASDDLLEGLDHARMTFKQLDDRLNEVQEVRKQLEGARDAQRTCQSACSDIKYDEGAHQLAKAELTAAHKAYTAAQLEEGKARSAVDHGERQWSEARALAAKLTTHELEIDRNALQLAREERLAEHLSGFQGHFFSVNVRAVMVRASQLIAPATNQAIRALELDSDAVLHYWDQFKQRHDARRLSGGEQALVGLCIRLALAERAQAILQNSRVKFLILDEVLGSLDEARRTAVQGILTNILDQGAFEYIIMITHLDEVKHNWDAHRLEIQLDRTSGMSSVAVLDSTWPT